MHRNEAQILKYDYLAIKDYNCNDERVGSKGEYILSFENRSLKVSLMAKKIIDRFDGKVVLMKYCKVSLWMEFLSQMRILLSLSSR